MKKKLTIETKFGQHVGPYNNYGPLHKLPVMNRKIRDLLDQLEVDKDYVDLYQSLLEFIDSSMTGKCKTSRQQFIERRRKEYLTS